MSENKKVIADTAYTFKYNNFKRILISTLYLVFFYFIGLFVVLFKWYIALVCLIVALPLLYIFLEIISFKKLIIDDRGVTRKSYLFGTRLISFNNLSTDCRHTLITGSIRFKEKGHTPLIFDVTPIGINNFLKIRKVLIDKHIIDGISNGWNW